MYEHWMGIRTIDGQTDNPLSRQIALAQRAERLFQSTFFIGCLQRRLARLLRGAQHDNHLLDLADNGRRTSAGSRNYRGTDVIPICKICGSENRSLDFDQAFYPLHPRSRARWKAIAILMLQNENLPPVELIQVGEVYYVRDGHHRISVAKALGQLDIDAIVIVWQTPPAQAELKPALCAS